MDVKIKWDDKKLAAVAKHVDWLRSNGLLEEVQKSDLESSSLQKLRGKFPASRRSAKRSETSKKEFPERLVQGWSAKTTIHAGKAGGKMRVFHRLADLGNERAITILSSLDTGSQAYTFVPGKTFTFMGRSGFRKKGQDSRGRLRGKAAFIWMKAGRRYPRPSRQGAQYMDATADHIKRVLLPRLRKRIVARAYDEWHKSNPPSNVKDYIARTRYINQAVGL